MAQLSHFAACCESYLGVWPEVANFLKFFHFKAQNITKGGSLTRTGCCAIYPRTSSPMPRFELPDTVKLWQRTYFYVSNATEIDWICLPPFTDVPLT